MYAKLFSSLLSSSIWSEELETRVIFMTLLAMSDREGYVYGSPVGLAALARMPVEATIRALDKLKAPDGYSSDLKRDSDRDGSRIKELDQGGWHLVNYVYYRDLADADVRRAQYRAYKKKLRGQSTNVPEGPHSSTSVHPSEAESYSDTDPLKRIRVRYSPDFEEWWLAYAPPSRRHGKGAAAKLWERLSLEDRRKAMTALPAFKASNQGTEDRYVCLAPTYLSQRRFDDFDGVPPEKPSKGAENYRKAMADLAKLKDGK